MSVALVAETNFNVMIPFVLADLAHLSRPSIARYMSIQATADIVGRLCVPLLAQKIGWSSRSLYAGSLVTSIIGRTRTYIYTKKYYSNCAQRVLER